MLRFYKINNDDHGFYLFPAIRCDKVYGYWSIHFLNLSYWMKWQSRHISKDKMIKNKILEIINLIRSEYKNDINARFVMDHRSYQIEVNNSDVLYNFEEFDPDCEKFNKVYDQIGELEILLEEEVLYTYAPF